MTSTVLVTGGSGFIASHILLKLLERGYRVRATVRDLKREPELRSILRAAGTPPGADLTFSSANLESDAGWDEAAEGCDYVLHVASPFPASAPRSDDDLIRPARDGALRVLRASRIAGVRRVVLTSSFAAIGYGHERRREPFDETAWTHLGPRTQAYVKSKTLAERAAWEYIATEGGGLEMSVINPVAVFGPLLSADLSSSVVLLKNMMRGAIAACPRLYFGLVDVRDVADLHLTAMVHPAARGERFLACAGDALPLIEMARILKRAVPELAGRVPSRELPDWLVRVAAVWSAAARQALPELGKIKHLSNAKARGLLAWTPRPNAEAIVATARSLAEMGLVGSKRD